MELKPASPETIARLLGECTVVAGGYKCKCPVHDDAKASLQINIVGSRDGKTTVHCHAGCKPADIFKAIEEKTGMYFESRMKISKTDDKINLVYPAPIDWPPELAYNGMAHSAAYPYYDDERNLMFVVARWNLPGGSKHIRPYSVANINGQMRWTARLKLPMKPIYNLAEVLERFEATVIIVEGEKAAEAGKYDPQFADYVVVTYQGGATSWKNTDWGPLRGRSLILIPDNDDAGRDAFVELAQHLGLNQFCLSIQIAHHDKAFPAKWDIADKWPEGRSFSTFQFYTAPEPNHDFIEDSITPVNYMEYYSNKYWLHYDGMFFSAIDKQAWVHFIGQSFNASGNLKRINNNFPGRKKCYVGRDPAIDLWADDLASRQKFVSGFRFRPGTSDPLVEEAGKTYLNSFTGFGFKEGDEQDCTVILNFIHDVICDSDENAYIYVLNYLSHMLQFPERRPTVAIVLKSIQGAGKSTFGMLIGRLLGSSENTSGYFGSFGVLDKVLGKFNAVLEDKIAIFVEELEITKSRTMENALKSLITDSKIMIEPKGREAYSTNNYARIFGGTNHNHIWNVTEDERRLTLLELSPKYAKNDVYFRAIREAINNIYVMRGFVKHLMEYKVDHSLVLYPLKNKARSNQAMATKNPNKELALKLLRSGEITLRLFDERKDVICGYHVSHQQWDDGFVRIPSNLTRRVIQAEIDTGKYGEAFFSARDKRVSIVELVKMLGAVADDHGSVPYSTMSIDQNGTKVKDSCYVIPALHQAKAAFCKYHNVEYGDIFDDEKEKIIHLPVDNVAEAPF